MATVTGLTAERMLEIEASSVVNARVEDGDLILIKHDGTEINVGSIAGPSGPQGPAGPPGLSAIPGEIKLWSGSALPDEATYGKWVWADGAVYPILTYPLAAANIDDLWNTFDGASDPGGGNFRVPDMRGLAAAGMDQMPGGTRGRANRMTRAVAIVLAGKTGKETHVLTVTEMPSHTHPSAGGHLHTAINPGTGNTLVSTKSVGEGILGDLLPYNNVITPETLFKEGGTAYSDIAVGNTGGSIAHENVQPTVMVPYIVCLGG